MHILVQFNELWYTFRTCDVLLPQHLCNMLCTFEGSLKKG